MKYLIYSKVDGIYSSRCGETRAYLRYDCDGYGTLEEAQSKIRDICLRSLYQIDDFKIFVEYPVE